MNEVLALLKGFVAALKAAKETRPSLVGYQVGGDLRPVALHAAANLASMAVLRLRACPCAGAKREPVGMMLRRWEKLETEFYDTEKDKVCLPVCQAGLALHASLRNSTARASCLCLQFNVSKIPDIHDSIKFYVQHNAHFGLPHSDRLLDLSEVGPCKGGGPWLRFVLLIFFWGGGAGVGRCRCATRVRHHQRGEAHHWAPHRLGSDDQGQATAAVGGGRSRLAFYAVDTPAWGCGAGLHGADCA
jgi:hypothetical protein